MIEKKKEMIEKKKECSEICDWYCRIDWIYFRTTSIGIVTTLGWGSNGSIHWVIFHGALVVVNASKNQLIDIYELKFIDLLDFERKSEGPYWCSILKSSKKISMHWYHNTYEVGCEIGGVGLLARYVLLPILFQKIVLNKKKFHVMMTMQMYRI
jgi:hypothetical protein